MDDAGDARRKALRVTARGDEMTAIGAARFDELRARWAAALEPGAADAVDAALARLPEVLRAKAGGGPAR